MKDLDEAIKHAEEVADHCEAFENQERGHDVRWMSRSRCAKEHRQLAEWLKDYKRLRKGVDEAIEEIKSLGYEVHEDGDVVVSAIISVDDVLDILKRHIGEAGE